MVKIQPFAVEQWMDKYETTPGVLNLAETCAASISIDQLQEMCEDPNMPGPISTSTKLTYGAIRGSKALRDRLAALYSVRTAESLPAENILVTSGAISANFLLLYTLVGPGDHVVCMHPTYQQLYTVPRSLGAEVSLWRLREENSFVPDLEYLKALVKPNTKMIIINNPNNPTSVIMTRTRLQLLVDYASERDIIILSDEVYRPMFHGISPADAEYPPSIVSMGYKRTIATGSLSKAYALAGIRVGWIASRDPTIIDAVAAARDYTTISVSQIDDHIASYALSSSVIHRLLGRNIALAKTNLAIMEVFIDQHRQFCSWVKPIAGTTAFVKFLKGQRPVDDEKFCIDVLEKVGVMFVPGKRCFGDGEVFEGYVRIGFVCETEILREALNRLGKYIQEALI